VCVCVVCVLYACLGVIFPRRMENGRLASMSVCQPWNSRALSGLVECSEARGSADTFDRPPQQAVTLGLAEDSRLDGGGEEEWQAM